MPERNPPPLLVPPFDDGTQALTERSCAALNVISQVNSVFGTLAWYKLLTCTAMTEGEKAAYLVIDGDDPSCMPFRRRSEGGTQRLEALSNFYSPQFEPVVRDGKAGELARAFAHFAAGTSPRPDIVDLRPLDSGSPFFAEAQDALRAAGFWVDSYFCFGNWYLELAGEPFEEYFQSRPSQLRNTWRRNRKKLEQRGLAIEILRENSPALEAAIVSYEAIYNSSWKHPEPFPAFIPGLCRMAAQHGWLRLGVLSIEGKAVASQIWFVKDGVASIFKLAYIEEFGKLSVGTVLTHELMRRAIDDDKVNMVDYLSGDDAYKKDWMTLRRERRGIIAFSQRRPKGIVSAARHFGGRWLKSIREAKSATSPATEPGAA